MAYLKPQSPLKNGEDHIYPLTTIDQIIMDDGSRLGAGGKLNIKPSDIGAVSTEVIPAVTTEDDGKFMVVVNGAWAVETVPSAEGASF